MMKQIDTLIDLKSWPELAINTRGAVNNRLTEAENPERNSSGDDIFAPSQQEERLYRFVRRQ